jgi:hypothetical protein
MIKHCAVVAGALVAVSVFSAQAQAQTFGGGLNGTPHAFSRPTTSPYLNLQAVDAFGIQGGYQTLVRPFVDSRKAINANSAAISRLQSSGGGGGGGGGNAGGGGQFMNYSHYYPSLSASGTGGRK